MALGKICQALGRQVNLPRMGERPHQAQWVHGLQKEGSCDQGLCRKAISVRAAIPIGPKESLSILNS